MSEEAPAYTLPPLAPGEALEVVRRVARPYTLVECACAACPAGVRASQGHLCGKCRGAGCRPFEGVVGCRAAPASAGVSGDDLGDIRQVGGQ